MKYGDMVYKPLDRKTFVRYIESVGWSFKKGGIDWNLYDENGFFCVPLK